MIEYRYFHRLTRKNKEKILEKLSKGVEIFMDSDDYEFLLHDMHMEICETLRNQTRSKVDRYKKD